MFGWHLAGRHRLLNPRHPRRRMLNLSLWRLHKKEANIFSYASSKSYKALKSSFKLNP